ncbi:hypothetical protein [Methanofollis ethanolicus]|uniref:hypothetical protein n=1 Tax=Methanofollis ethanolicus TaxID=488124 RepID=UPI00128ED4FB|nr:hypothetical protein [Methanofollis ethanolicus]
MAPDLFASQCRRPSCHVRRCTRVLVSLEHDSIANHVDNLDGMVVFCRCRETMRQCGLSPRRA